jgi:Tfp pilus assembly protein PilN
VDAANRMVLTVAVGLALPFEERFNLLPVDLQAHRKRWNVRAPVAYATLGLLFLLPLGQYGWQSQKNISALRETVKLKKSAFDQYKYVLQEHEKLKAKRSQLDAKLTKLPTLDLSIPRLAAALRLVSQEIPEEVVLTSLDVQKGETAGDLEVRLSGLVFGQKKEAFPTLTTFMEKLEKTPMFSDVQLGAGDGEAPESAVLAFEIGCRVK